MKDRSCAQHHRRNATFILSTLITAALLLTVGGIAPLVRAEVVVAFETGGGKGIFKTDFDVKTICAYDLSGRVLVRWTGDLTMGDTLRVGDVNGDGIAEIVKAGDKFRSVTVFDGGHRQLMTFIAGYTKNDGFAIARHP